MSFQVKGLTKLTMALKNIPKNAEVEVKDVLTNITQDLQAKSVKLAPKDIGALRGSSFSEVERLVGTVGFTEEYATKQHEEIGYNHPHGGEAKFLETPYKENCNNYVKKIGEAARKGAEK